MLASCSLLSVLSLILHLSASVSGLLETRTIDDAGGDSADPNAKPIFSPNGAWSAQPNGCSNCNINPDNPARAFNGTWHDNTHLAGALTSSVQFSFTGIALSVFCILPPKTAQAITAYNLTFILDGQPVGPPFTRTTEQLTNSFQYNVSVLSLNNLQNNKHTFVMQMANQADNSVALFDYASYIYNDQGIISQVDETKKKPNLGAILGGVLGSIAILGGTVFLFLFSRRRRAEVRDMQQAQAVPFDSVMRIDLPDNNRQGEPSPPSISPVFGSNSNTSDIEKGPPPAYSPQ